MFANGISLARLAMAPALAAVLLADRPVAAGWLFVAAVASDFLDGWLARTRGTVTPFGGFLDHVADASFVVCGLAALSRVDGVPALLPVLVALAFTQYALDSRVVTGGSLRASALGRWNGIAYFVLLGIPVVRDALGLGWPGAGLVEALAWLLVVSTVASMLDRLIHLTRR